MPRPGRLFSGSSSLCGVRENAATLRGTVFYNNKRDTSDVEYPFVLSRKLCYKM